MKTVYVELKKSRYPIYIGSGILRDSSVMANLMNASQIAIVTNKVIASHYLDLLVESIRKNQPKAKIEVVLLPEGEAHKNQAALDQIFDTLIGANFNRDCQIVALGGGIVGDIAGFAAASYQRGVDFIQIPTTLLAQVDSSVGGKTGINHRLGKNMIGAFKQPTAVIIDTDVLSTLPRREISAGMAEVIKYGLIRDKAFLQRLDEILEDAMALAPSAIAEIIEKSCQHKAEVVANDEKEKGERATLNLGHTFGHAIEAVTKYQRYLHGEAVAIGTMMAVDLSQSLGWISAEDCQFVENLFHRTGCPTQLTEHISAETIRETMQSDKKVLKGQLRLILLKSLGQAVICDNIDDSLILKHIQERTLA